MPVSRRYVEDLENDCMTGFWIGIVITVLIVIGVSVVAGKALSGPKNPRQRGSRDDKVMALKASGALRHRKSNRE
jgi:hypothetical protein